MYYGGKRKDAKHIVPLIRENLTKDNTYYEPFVGGGAVWLELNHNKNVIGDIVPDLMNMYECIQKEPQEVLTHYKQFKNCKEDFYRVRSLDRDSQYSELSNSFKAARYIFLTKTSFGSATFNKKGQINQAYYNLPERSIEINEKDYRAMNELLQDTELLLQSFEITLKEPQEGDFVYLDPPYIESRYDRYYTDKFTFDDMVVLKECCDELDKKGVKFALSHSKNEKVNELFKEYNKRELSVSRTLLYSGKTLDEKETDYLITNF